MARRRQHFGVRGLRRRDCVPILPNCMRNTMKDNGICIGTKIAEHSGMSNSEEARVAAKRPVIPQTLGVISATDGAFAESMGLSASASLAIARALQTTLEIEPLLTLFQEQAGDRVQFAALRYRFPELGLDHVTGRRGVHSCTYGFQIEGEHLGEIEFSARARFSDADQMRLESLLTLLVHPLRNALRYRRAVNAAQRDHLTGAYSRRVLDDTLFHEVDLAQRTTSPLAVLLLDLDHFKNINSAHGHQGGDTVLRAVVTAVQACIRSCDLLFRYGGEEFVVVARNCLPEGAECLAERIRATIEDLDCQYEDAAIRVTTSLGLSSHVSGDDATTLLARADRALRRAKTAGRNRVVAG